MGIFSSLYGMYKGFSKNGQYFMDHGLNDTSAFISRFEGYKYIDTIITSTEMSDNEFETLLKKYMEHSQYLNNVNSATRYNNEDCRQARLTTLKMFKNILLELTESQSSQGCSLYKIITERKWLVAYILFVKDMNYSGGYAKQILKKFYYQPMIVASATNNETNTTANVESVPDPSILDKYASLRQSTNPTTNVESVPDLSKYADAVRRGGADTELADTELADTELADTELYDNSREDYYLNNISRKLSTLTSDVYNFKLTELNELLEDLNNHVEDLIKNDPYDNTNSNGGKKYTRNVNANKKKKTSKKRRNYKKSKRVSTYLSKSTKYHKASRRI